MMSRKHYVAIAKAMAYVKPSQQARPQGFKQRTEAWATTVVALVEVFEKDNPNFDRARFLTACGITEI